jgi:hypothetical protein
MLGSCLVPSPDKGSVLEQDPTDREYHQNLTQARAHYQAVFCQSQKMKMTVSAPVVADIEPRLEIVKSGLKSIFEEKGVMHNLIHEVQQMIHSVLQASESDILHLFKSRLQVRYWQSGRDLLMGRIGDEVGRHITDFMALSHVKAAEKQTLAEPLIRSDLKAKDNLFCIRPFFKDFHHGDGQSQGSGVAVTEKQAAEAMVFLSKLYSLMNALDFSAAKSNAMSKMKQCLEKDKLGCAAIEDMKQRIGSTHTSLKMMDPSFEGDDGGDSGSWACVREQLVRPAFVGGESVGKSTCINSMLDPTLCRKVLPTGDVQVTQCMTIIKHGACDEIYYGDQRESSPEVSYDMLNQLEQHNLKIKNSRLRKKPSLDSPLLTRVTPFSTDLAKRLKPQFIDVPGMRTDNQLETALALGVSTHMVICTTDVVSLNDDLTEHALVRLKELYQNLQPPPPIVVAITKPDDDAIHLFDRSTFALPIQRRQKKV